MPPQISGLPRDERGYPVPAENHWVEGAPLLAKQDRRRFATLLTSWRCAICGCKFTPSEVLYRLFANDEARHTEQIGGLVRTDGPAHHACAVFSAMVCPFFATPRARHSSARSARGDRAAIMGFRTVLTDADFNNVGGLDHLSFHYSDLADTEWFESPAQLGGLLARAVRRQARIDVDDRMYWTTSEDLLPDFKNARKILKALKPTTTSPPVSGKNFWARP